MRKIKIIEHISLDGVIQAPGGPSEDGDYPYGGWSVPHADPAVGEAIVEAHGESFDLLLGRRTYDIWSGYWPAESGPMADSLNAATKFVATHRPGSLEWGPAKAIGPDVVDGVRRIKLTDGPDVIVWGSSTLTPLLLEHALAEEVLLLVIPVLLGVGKRFFADGTPPRELALVSTKAASSGVIVSTYRPSGYLRTGSFEDTTVQELIAQAYSAFNRRDVDAVLKLMSANVDWPKASESGRAVGKQEIREYWSRQWAELDPRVDALEVIEREPGKVDVRVHQVVKNLKGDVMSDTELWHSYSIPNGLIERMDISEEAP